MCHVTITVALRSPEVHPLSSQYIPASVERERSISLCAVIRESIVEHIEARAQRERQRHWQAQCQLVPAK